MYTEDWPTLRDANTVANLAAMVDTSALYWAEPSEFSPNRVCRLLPSSVVKVRLSIVSSSTFTCDRFDDTTQESQVVGRRGCVRKGQHSSCSCCLVHFPRGGGTRMTSDG